MSAERGRSVRVWGGGLRRVTRFFGRREELEHLDAWWASESHALLITGIAGIGKSALVATWTQERRLGRPVYGCEIRRSTTAAGFLREFAAFLATLGKPNLAAHLDEGLPPDLAFVARLLKRDLAHHRVLVVLDNADQASKELARTLTEGFLREAAGIPVRLILIGRRSPSWLGGDRTLSSLETHQVQGLDTAASRALLRSRGLAPDAASTDAIIRETRGHPLLLHLAASTGAGQGSMVQRYLEEEVWDSLTAKERAVLESASISRTSVTERMLAVVAGADRRTLESLVERSLLERTMAGTYTMHDLVRNFAERQLPSYRRRRMHELFANLLIRSMESRDRWEGIYHLVEAGRVAEAAGLLDSEGASLLDCVAAEDIGSLVREFTIDETEPGPYCVIAETLGDALRIRGHVGPALFQYGHARRLAENSEQARRVPRLLRKMAYIERCRNRYAKALGYLVEAQARLGESRDRSESTEVLREMALAEQATGDLDKAAQHLSEAVDLATELADKAALSRTLLALGSLQTRQGRLDLGLESELEGLRIAERSGNLTELAHAHIVVGTTLEEMGRLDESLRHYERGMELAQLLGNLRLTAYAALGRVGTFIELGKFHEAGPLLRETEGYFGILEENDTLALLKTYEGQRQMGLGNWTRAKGAWEEGLESLRASGSPADLALALRQIGEFYVRGGEVETGRAHLLEALNLSTKIGNVKLREEAERLLAGVERPARASA